MGKYITVSKYSFWKENRVQLFLIVLCGVTSLYGFITGSYVPAVCGCPERDSHMQESVTKVGSLGMKNKVTGA
jgi:hypothetical protein